MPVSALPQTTVRLDVAFYDEAERQKLLRQYPAAGAAMQRLVEQGVEMPTAEFLTYYLFHRKRLGTPGYRDYATIGHKLDVALAALDECLDFNGRSVCTPAGVRHQLNEVSEHVGEAVGLAVASRIHDLTEADWSPIAEQRGRGAAPSFDFQIASDGQAFIQVETKGSSVTNNRVADATIAEQKRKITEKKEKLAVLAKQGKDPNPAGIRYGTVTAVDPRRDGNIKCWLVDPPPDRIEDTPKRFRLLQRMRFLRNWIAFVSPRSQLASALSTRLGDLESLRDPFELDSVPLRRGTGEPFEFVPFGARGRHSTFLANKSRITDGPAGGVVLQLSPHALFLVGFREDLLVIASKQSFEQVANFRTEAGSLAKIVECVFSHSRFDKLQLPTSIRSQATQFGGHVGFRLQGQMHYSSSGLVFGILPLPNS